MNFLLDLLSQFLPALIETELTAESINNEAFLTSIAQIYLCRALRASRG